ncbi:MAG: DUF262 domain-containing protein [Flavobacteriaceae bacterium]|nr:DUF262 domain-containing protein [Flavobacteriaceae bacterium]
MTKQQTKSTPYSFWQLMQEYTIEIPIIQRDYAQGRADEKTAQIRSRFVDALVTAIVDKTPQELDFIYGEVKDKVFQPLDGQQRLTTLFLLHWYIAYRSDSLKENQWLSTFSYQTRISSREFCQGLVGNTNLGKGETISQKLQDAPWYFAAWNYDPNIQSMLIMLDCIEEKLKEKNKKEIEEFWDSLRKNDAPIRFSFIPLKNIGLTDDLYIKMNARGKPLSPFENFKASFEKNLEEAEWHPKDSIAFSKKMDNDYANLFWNPESQKNWDDRFLQFIAGIAICFYAENPQEKDPNNLEKLIQKLAKQPDNLVATDFNSKSAFEFLEGHLDKYAKLDEGSLPTSESHYFGKSDTSLFETFIDKPTYKDRALFYAQSKCLINETEKETTNQFIRVVRNMLENSTVDSPKSFISAIGFIQELSELLKENHSSFYSSLEKIEFNSGFAKEQFEEERIKAKLLAGDAKEKWKEQIHKIENNVFIKGQIRFLLAMAVVDEKGTYDLNSFTSLSESFVQLFAPKDKVPLDDLLRRAMLTKGDFKLHEGYASILGAYRYHLIRTSSELKNATRGMIKNPNRYGEFGKTLKALLSDFPEETKTERDDFLNGCIQSYLDREPFDDYRHKLIENKELLNYCWHKRICLKGNILYVMQKTKAYKEKENYKEIVLKENTSS